MTAKVFDHLNDPVFIEDGEARHVVLRIGARKPGEVRSGACDRVKPRTL
jgi:hypothetical protein